MVMKPGIQTPNVGAGSAIVTGCPTNSAEGGFSRSDTSNPNLEGLVFDTEKFALSNEDVIHVAGPAPAYSSESDAVRQQVSAEPRIHVSRRSHLIHLFNGLKARVHNHHFHVWTAIIILLGIAVAGAFLHTACSDGYRVETKLLLFERDHNPNTAVDRTLEQEVQILKSPHILHLLSRELYDRESSGIAPDGYFRTSSIASGKLSGFGSPSDLEEWLTKRTRISSEISGGTARVALRLRGDDPDFLRNTLDAYICSYVGHRRAIESASKNQSWQARHQDRHLSDAVSAEMISTHLQKINLREQGSKLALQLIDSGKGVFSGFVPDQSLTGVSSLTHFQDKIIQLEIKKKALAAQFMPTSREITVVDLEIQGVRSAMRECLVEHLEFLKKEKEQLLARKEVPFKDVSDQASKEHCGTESPGSANSWLVPRDGLYLLRETPVIAQRPLLVRTGNFANKLMAYLAFSPAATVASELDRRQDLSRPQSLSVDGRTYNAGGHFQGGPKYQSQPGLTTPPVWQRAATSHGNTVQQHTGPLNSRPKQ